MKTSGVILLLGLLTGCAQFQGKEVVQAYSHGEVYSESNLVKSAVLWEIDLLDKRDGSARTISLNDFGFFPGKPLEQEALELLAGQLAAEVDRPMLNPSINTQGEITPGHERIILSESELVEELMKLPPGAKEITLPIYVTAPTVTEEQLIGIDSHILAEFRTYYNSGVQGRSKNIELSAAAIQDIVLGPGDDFSFNRTVGERTRERGYQEAKEIVNKEFIMGIGGGICQTSSTLFNAIDAAGLEVIERFTHSREIGYVQSGRDATVSWGGPDFRFRNPLPHPVIIRTQVSHQRGELTVTVLTHSL
ncbi:VanW family protein [Bacillus solitudinis]|uniref:VanW family protein n=1 Tax=Bacillus solitudinis TaxID=2014074 RepID=UPI001D0D6BE6|nr:VanW family protein [Bacillus solitudinis]